MSTPEPLAEGLTYHTLIQPGRMLHVGQHHLVVASFGNGDDAGDVTAYTWDEVLLAVMLIQRKRNEELAKVYAKQQAESKSLVEAKPHTRLGRFLAERRR